MDKDIQGCFSELEFLVFDNFNLMSILKDYCQYNIDNNVANIGIIASLVDIIYEKQYKITQSLDVLYDEVENR